MGAIGDEMALADQEKLDQQQAADHARQYNADGSAKANDFRPPKLPESAFPASLGAGRQLRVNRDQLGAVKNQMGSDLARLQATLQQLIGNGAFGGLGKTVTNYADAETTTASAASKIGAEASPGGAQSG
jgi:hypothetical protein